LLDLLVGNCVICDLADFALSHKLDAAAVLLELQCHDDLFLAPQSKGQCDIGECLHKKGGVVALADQEIRSNGPNIIPSPLSHRSLLLS
jgi:hypothetical protein